MKYFTFPEFERSSVAESKGYDNRASLGVQQNIEYLVDTILDPLREHLGCPVIITSGYRCPALNREVGGSPSSQHRLGLAADFVPMGMRPKDFDEIRHWFRRQQILHAKALAVHWDASKPFDQLIDYGTFFHVGLRPPNIANRFQILHRASRQSR